MRSRAERGEALLARIPILPGPSESGILPACRRHGADRTDDGEKSLLCRQTKPADDAHRTADFRIHSAETAMIGDRMDTDIIAGIESGLIRSVPFGVTGRREIKKYPYHPSAYSHGVSAIPPA